MRRVSLNARHALDDHASSEVEVVLIEITHPSLDAPVRLSTDPTERISIEPLVYGTRSTWQSANGNDPFLFCLVSALLPDDRDEAPPVAQIVLDLVDADMAVPLRSTLDRATVSFAVVYASAPDLVEAEFLGLSLMSAEGDAGQISLAISRDPITKESWPSRRMSRDVTPGLHR